MTSFDTTTLWQDREQKQRWLVTGLSVAVPLVVAALFRVKIDTEPLTFLPPFYASINAITAVVLILAGIAARQKKILRHKALIHLALGLSSVFLVCYVAWHLTSNTIYFGDADGNGSLSAMELQTVATQRLFYYPLLISHIVLSIAVIPLVLFTYLRGLRATGKGASYDLRAQHRQLARIAYPIWLYVTISGVIVYLMIHPYYPA